MQNNLSPIDTPRNSGIYPGIKKGTEGTMDNSRVYDPVHFQANPMSHGYQSKAQAIKENQADYLNVQGLTYGDSRKK